MAGVVSLAVTVRMQWLFVWQSLKTEVMGKKAEPAHLPNAELKEVPLVH